MTDYKTLKLKASSSPHIRAVDDTRGAMLDVIIAMLPALGFAIFNFGLRALMQVVISVVGCVVFEALYRFLTKKRQTVGDLSAAVTGMLIAFVCPVTVPFWMLLVGDFFAIFIVKQLYGGLGKNFVNPALAARAFLFSWAGQMSTWVVSGSQNSLFGGVDAATAATPMSYLHTGDLTGLLQNYKIEQLFVGTIGGSLGETSALCLLCGFVYLLARKVISWHIPVCYVGTVAILTFLFPRGNDPVTWMLANIFSGGLMLGAIFMATDYVTSPISILGRVIFGVGCGLITVAIRYFGAYPEGVCYSILCMNLVVWLLDRYVKPRQFGVMKKEKKEASKS